MEIGRGYETAGPEREVSKDQFYGYVAPRDIHSSAGKMQTLWKDRRGVVLGRSTPGYLLEGEERYWLCREEINE